MTAKTHVPRQRLRPEHTYHKVVLDAAGLNLTLAEAFEPGRFSARQFDLGANLLLTIVASDGWAFGLVRRADEDGNLVIEQQAPYSAPVLALKSDDSPAARKRAAA